MIGWGLTGTIGRRSTWFCRWGITRAIGRVSTWTFGWGIAWASGLTVSCDEIGRRIILASLQIFLDSLRLLAMLRIQFAPSYIVPFSIRMVPTTDRFFAAVDCNRRNHAKGRDAHKEKYFS